MKLQFSLLLLFVTLFVSCTQNQDCENEVDLGDVSSNLKMVRLEKILFNAKSPLDVKQMLINYPVVAQKVIGINPNDSVAVNDLFRFYTQESLKEFYKQGEKSIGSFGDLEAETKSMFDHIKYYFPTYRTPEVFTIVTGLPPKSPGELIPDVIALDSAIAIGIDYFYGQKSKFRPREYNYMLQRREPYFIVPSVALRVAQEDFVEYDANDKTMLAEMIKWGKAHYFIKRMMPCTPDSIVIGYTSEQMKEVTENMDLIWGYFIENKLFYETKADEINRFVGEAPKVALIGEKCPGRIGRYLGYLIVKAYMEKNPKVTVPQLMKEVDSQKIFKLSKYKPKTK